MAISSIKNLKPTKCPYCNSDVKLIYIGKGIKCESGYIYKCVNCNARVNTFPKDKTIAMGILATKEMGEMRIKVHRLLDKFWKNNKQRQECYQRLAKELGIEESETHIAYMDMETLLKAEQILLKWWREKYDR